MALSGVRHDNPHTMTDNSPFMCEDLRVESEHRDVSADETDDERRHPRARRVLSEIGRVVRIDRSAIAHSQDHESRRHHR